MALAPNPKVIASGSGHAALIREYPEAASQSFKAGQLVYLASGKVTACASDATTILGIALSDASGTQDTSIPVHVFTPEDIIRIKCHDGTSEVTSDNATLGAAYAIRVASNVVYLDTGDTVNKAFVVVGQEQDASGYTKWARVRVLPTVAQEVVA